MMELSSHVEEAEIPMPINSAFVGLHMHANSHGHHGHLMDHHGHEPSSSSSHNHHNIIPSKNSNNGTTTTAPILEEDDNPHHHHATLHGGNIMINDDVHDDNDDGHDDDVDDHDDMCMKKKSKKIIRYKECQKNHAASMGGNAKDGCGEFMPSGEQGSLEYFICSACNCHRNFHRKEIEGDDDHHDDQHLKMMMIHQPAHSQFYPPTTAHPHLLGSRGRKVILGGTGTVGQPRVPFSRSLAINLPYSLVTDHHHGTNGGGIMMMNHNNHNYNNHNHSTNQVVKKRFRTKFSQEQKEKMYEFAEKAGWKIQRQEESVVQQFCQQIGIKRRVLKVWMHNNKHNLAKKTSIDNIANDNNINNDNNSS